MAPERTTVLARVIGAIAKELRRTADLIKRDTVALTIANLNYALVGLITGIVTARTLGAEGRGDLAVIVFWPTLSATLVDLGIGEALTLWTSRNAVAVRSQVLNAVLLASGASAMGMLVGWAALPMLLQTGQAGLIGSARVALWLIPAWVFSLIPIGALLGLHEFRAVALVRVLSVLGYLISVVAAVTVTHPTPVTFMWLTVLSRALPIPIGMVFLIPALMRAAPARALMGRQMRDGMALHAGRLSTVASASEDRAIANWTLTQDSIGQWHVASTLMFLIPFISQGVSQQLFAQSARRPEGERFALLSVAYTRSVLLTGALAIAGAMLLPVAIPLVFGREFVPSAVPAIVIAFASVLSAGCTVLQAGARAAMKNRICVEAEIAGIAAMALASFPMIRSLELVGLAGALFIGRGACLAWMMTRGRQVLGWKIGELVPLSRGFTRHAAAEVRLFSSILSGNGTDH